MNKKYIFRIGFSIDYINKRVFLSYREWQDTEFTFLMGMLWFYKITMQRFFFYGIILFKKFRILVHVSNGYPLAVF